MKFVLAVIGMALFLEGLPYFLFPQKTKKILEEIQMLPSSVLRLIGFLMLAFGLLVTYLSQKLI